MRTQLPAARVASRRPRWALGPCLALCLAAAGSLASCGDDSQPYSRLGARCAAPRAGTADVQGTADDEKAWLRSWTDELYLWYREVPDADPAAYATPVAYFGALKTPAVTPSGKDKDQFHFALSTAEWKALSQSGVDVGYGALWLLLARKPPRQTVVGYVEPGSPAAAAGLARGAELIEIDGEPVVDGDAARLNAGLSPSAAGESHSFTVRDLGATADRPVTLTAENVQSSPVPTVQVLPGGLGYVLFNDHIATAEAAIVEAVRQLQAGAVTDLVLDLRYNGGGYLDIANELAFMIAGPAATAGKTFGRNVFNDKHPTNDPVTGEALTGTPFQATSLGFVPAALPAGQALPTLSLTRVFVLTGGGTCSASESIVNGLQGIGVTVIQIGSTTCGKPYGFYPQDNCGTTYFSIQFREVNAKGFGDYADGFTPGGTGEASPPGCLVADDFAHALGDPAEARLAAALHYRANGACPPAAALGRGVALRAAAADPGERGWRVARPPWRESRVLGR